MLMKITFACKGQRNHECKVEGSWGGGTLTKRGGGVCVYNFHSICSFFLPFDATAHAALSTILVHFHGQLYNLIFFVRVGIETGLDVCRTVHKHQTSYIGMVHSWGW